MIESKTVTMMAYKKAQIITISMSLLVSLSLITLYMPDVTCESLDKEEPNRISRETFQNIPVISRSPAKEIPCQVYRDYDVNTLTPIDVVARNSETKVACIKAKFALSIKLEEAVLPILENYDDDPQRLEQSNGTGTRLSFLGFLPLEVSEAEIISVEDSCPDKSSEKPNESKPENGENQKQEEGNTDQTEDGRAEPDKDETNDEEQELIVTFGCGKLAFTFKRDKTHVFVSSIKGVVKLGDYLVREFVSNKPVFLTSDLEHHFKYDNLIEVVSAQSNGYVLTANFYFTEIEAFRETKSRDFVLPADELSKPYSDEQKTPIIALAHTTTHSPLSNLNT